MVCAALLLCSISAFAAPAQVILIRHGEKPAQGSELNAQGFQRAKALVAYFQTEPAVTRYGTPVAIYAMAPKNAAGSVRAIQTVTPLAAALKLPINKDYLRDQTAELVKAIMETPEYDGRMVLVCWEHSVIVDIAAALAAYGGSDQAVKDSLPTAWAGQVFDRAWVLDFTGSKVTAFKDVPEHVLPGDSPVKKAEEADSN
jgi:hypothetical protein